MCSDERYFNVSLTVKGKNTVHKLQFVKGNESKSQTRLSLSAYQPNALQLDQTSSQPLDWHRINLFLNLPTSIKGTRLLKNKFHPKVRKDSNKNSKNQGFGFQNVMLSWFHIQFLKFSFVHDGQWMGCTQQWQVIQPACLCCVCYLWYRAWDDQNQRGSVKLLGHLSYLSVFRNQVLLAKKKSAISSKFW